MVNVISFGEDRPSRRVASFTLIEMLTVIAIIAILAALTLAAGSAVMNKASRSRASSEVQAMSTALEGYKTDNGIYPSTSTLTFPTNAYAANDPTTVGGLYQQSSEILFLNLSGQTNLADQPVAGVKVYMSFKRNQVGDSANGSYVKDPWSYSYGYSASTNTANPPYNGVGFFDLWSTGGLKGGASGPETNTAAWLSNWQ